MPRTRAGRADGLRRLLGRAQCFQLVWSDAKGVARHVAEREPSGALLKKP
jgi:hypothetical protein